MIYKASTIQDKHWFHTIAYLPIITRITNLIVDILFIFLSWWIIAYIFQLLLLKYDFFA